MKNNLRDIIDTAYDTVYDACETWSPDNQPEDHFYDLIVPFANICDRELARMYTRLRHENRI